MNIVVGLDPGGAGKFGWSVHPVTASPGSIVTPIVAGLGNNAEDVHGQVLAHLNTSGASLIAIGVDAPLGFDPANDRDVDHALRRTLAPSASGHVMSQNSLMGAVTIQGLLVVHLFRASHGVRVTESHPWVVNSNGAYDCPHPHAPTDDDRCSSSLAAMSALAMLAGGLPLPLGAAGTRWVNLHGLTCACGQCPGGPLRPAFMPVPHDYWLPV